LITEVVDRLEKQYDGMDAYLCGPPPMVDAAVDLLVARGIPEDRVYFDKFTTTAG
jgi:propane monooxygenase reductase subunit